MPDDRSPKRPKLADPGSMPRPGLGFGGGVSRDELIYDKRGDSWQVTVQVLDTQTPQAHLAGSRVIFELRAEFDPAEPLPEFAAMGPPGRRVETTIIETEDAAKAAAMAATDLLRAGRDVDLVALRRRFVR